MHPAPNELDTAQALGEYHGGVDHQLAGYNDTTIMSAEIPTEDPVTLRGEHAIATAISTFAGIPTLTDPVTALRVYRDAYTAARTKHHTAHRTSAANRQRVTT